MPRITVDLPDRFVYTTELAVYINHINYGHHLDNSALLALVSEARVRFFRSMDYTELNVDGVGIIVADVAVQYRSEAFHGEVLLFELAAHDFNKYGCDIVWKISEKISGREVARGKTGILFFDYAEKKKAMVPPRFQARAASP